MTRQDIALWPLLPQERGKLDERQAGGVAILSQCDRRYIESLAAAARGALLFVRTVNY